MTQTVRDKEKELDPFDLKQKILEDDEMHLKNYKHFQLIRSIMEKPVHEKTNGELDVISEILMQYKIIKEI